MAKAKKKLIREAFNKACLERDNYRCKICDVHNPFLEVHHITDRTLMPNGGYVKSNGITLCSDCHEKAEVWHSSGETKFEPGMHPNDLYKLIGSSYDEALIASEKLNK